MADNNKTEKGSFFGKLFSGLAKTRQGITARIDKVFASLGKIDENLFDELEEVLITSDINLEVTEKIMNKLRERIKAERITDPKDIREVLHDELLSLLGDNPPGLHLSSKPAVIIVLGVNGTGKTTSIAKIANLLKTQGNKVLLAAGDTFRAAAGDQLEIWADRAGVDIVRNTEGSDPAAVIFDAIQSAKSRKYDVLICDTAGRLHTKKNLMEELKKIFRIVDRELPDSSKEVLLVLDAGAGQNAVSQAITFSEAVGITGIVLTKLDGTAKGGVIFSIRAQLDVPVKFIGVGEGIDDLRYFEPKDFIKALFNA
ncbi:MAG: signal recognition particle-docking protein FtsY [Eubacteriales bacterium]|nr:signal recognition particle-docking protein FtsY [Eubacteriales bacterium]